MRKTYNRMLRSSKETFESARTEGSSNPERDTVVMIDFKKFNLAWGNDMVELIRYERGRNLALKMGYSDDVSWEFSLP